MSQPDNPRVVVSRRAPRATSLHPLTYAVGAAEGAAIAAGALAAASPALPSSATETPAGWFGMLGAGALAGAYAARRRALRAIPGAPGADEPGSVAPGSPDAWLQVVCGTSRGRVVGVLCELMARSLARGERVLVIDGARRLELHGPFGAEQRLGVVECLAGRMPLLGLVQNGGHPGLYLLAHGSPAIEERWPGLGRLLDQARPHFTRAFLVIEGAVPHAVGDALRGRLLEGWWAGDSRSLERAALALSERLGISFRRFDLGEPTEVSLEALAPRVAALRAALPQPVAEPEALAEPVAEEAPARERARLEVLDCDLHVRERLRFLIWMRRVQSESQREALVPALRG